MNHSAQRQYQPGGLELIEESVHLLRTAPPATLAAYYLGAVPFVLGFLFFWADMSRSSLAFGHLTEASLGLAALFLWMKSCQAIFAGRLRGSLAGESAGHLSLRQCLRIFNRQASVQSSVFFVLPLALLLILPFAWVFAFYQNLAVLGHRGLDNARELLKESRRQATLWPRQNHILLLALAGFSLGVFLNWTAVCLVLPGLVKMLFGVESSFSRSGLSLLNSTFFATMFALTYLSVDPIVKAAYTLRCFYGQAIESGEDLKAELRRVTAPAGVLATLLVWLVGAGASGLAQTLPAPAPTPLPAVGRSADHPTVQISPPDLDRAIELVIGQTKYAWRLPREKAAPARGEPGVIRRFLSAVGEMIRHWLQNALDWLEKWWRKLFGRSSSAGSSGAGYGWIFWLEILLYALLAAVLTAVVLLILRLRRRRQDRAGALASQPLPAAPDLSDESLGPEHLPEAGWAELARELLSRGEFRLALRAFYLASLAHLADRQLISLARFKSNREYEHELRRRGHSLPELLSVFAENLAVFERSWYGLHQVNQEVVSQFAANLERLRSSS